MTKVLHVKKSEILVLNQFPFWIRYLHPRYLEYCNEITGKWVYHESSEKLHEISFSMLDFICEGLTSEIKYRPTPNDPAGLFAHLNPPLCVYATNENKEELGQRIKVRIGDIYWQSNENTELLHRNIR